MNRFVLVLLTLALGCAPHWNDVVYVPDPADPYPEVAKAPPSCPKACFRLEKLGCPEASDGADVCAVVCTLALELRPFDLACVQKARSQAEVARCAGFRCR